MTTQGRIVMQFWKIGLFIIGLAIASSATPITSPLKAKPGSKKPASKPLNLIIQLSFAAEHASKMKSLEAIPELERWGDLLKQGKARKKFLGNLLKQTEALIEENTKNAEADPSQALFYEKLIEDLEDQADRIFEHNDILGEAIEKLEKEVNRLSADPKVAKILKAQELRRRISRQLLEANGILPPALRKLVQEEK